MGPKGKRQSIGVFEVVMYRTTLLAAAALLLALGTHRLEGESLGGRGTMVTQGSGGMAASEPQTVRPARVTEAYGKLPLSFEANEGQTDHRVKFLARGPGYSLFLTAQEAVLALEEACGKPSDFA